MKTCKKTTLLRNNGRKERQECYPYILLQIYIGRYLFVFLICHRSMVEYSSCLHPVLFLYFLQVHPYLKWSFAKTFLLSALHIYIYTHTHTQERDAGKTAKRTQNKMLLHQLMTNKRVHRKLFSDDGKKNLHFAQAVFKNYARESKFSYLQRFSCI